MAEEAGRIRIGCDVNTEDADKSIDDLRKAVQNLSSVLNGVGSKSSANSGSKKLSNIGKSADTSTTSVKKLGSSIGTLSGKISQAGNSAIKVATSIKNTYTELLSKIKLIKSAVQSFYNTFTSLSSAYNTQQSAESRFEVAITNSANATKEQIQNIKDLTGEYQQLGVIGDEVQLSGLRTLSAYVSSTESLKELLPVLNDVVAQQYGFEASTENAASTAKIIGKALSGEVSSLKKYGYALTEAQEQLLKYGTEEQKVATLTEVIESRVGGMNEALANTPTGQVTQLKNNLGDLKESLGELLTYVVLPIAKYLNTIITSAISGIKAVTEFIKTTFGIKTVTKEISSISNIDTGRTATRLDSVSDSLDTVGDSADSTKKKVKNLLAPFDELNILSDSSSSDLLDLSESMDSMDLGYGVAQTIEVPELSELRDRIENLLSTIDFVGLGEDLGKKFNTAIDSWNPSVSAEKIAKVLNTAIQLVKSFLDTADFENLGAKVGDWINKFVLTFDAKTAGETIRDLINSALLWAKGLLTSTDFEGLGAAIGDFLSGLFNNTALYENLADAFILTISGVVDVASGILKKTDFAAVGKGLAAGINKFSKATNVWVKLAHTLSDVIKGIFTLVGSMLSNTDFAALGTAIGKFIAEIDWVGVLQAAGKALWEAFKAVIYLNKGIFDANPIAGTISGIITALLLFKGVKGVAKIVTDIGKSFWFISDATKTQIVGKDTTKGISGLSSSLIGLINAHPAVATITGIATAITGVSIAIASIYADYIKKKAEWEQYLLNITALNEAQSAFIASTKESNTKIQDIKEAIKGSADTADKDAAKFKALYDRLSECVDEYGNIKSGSEDYANYLIGELNDSYNTNLENIDGQIKGYTELQDSIDKTIAKMRGLALVESNESTYTDAIIEQKKASKDIVEAQEGYENNLTDLREVASKVKDAYFAMFNEVLDFSDINTQGGLDRLKKAMHDLNWAMNKGEGIEFGDYKDNKSSIPEIVSMVEGYYADINAIAKKYNMSIGSGTSIGDNVTKLAYALHNNAYEFLNAKNIAEETYEETGKQIENYELLTQTVTNQTASVQDLNTAYELYVGTLKKSEGKNSIEELKQQYVECEKEYTKFADLVQEGKVAKAVAEDAEKARDVALRELLLAKADLREGVATYTAEATSALLQASGLTPTEYVKFYNKLFGSEHIPEVIKSLSNSSNISPSVFIAAYISEQPDITKAQIQELARKLYPNSTDKEIEELVATSLSVANSAAISSYISKHQNLTESEKKSYIKSLLPADSDTALAEKVEELYTQSLVTGTDSALQNFKDYFKGTRSTLRSDGLTKAMLTNTRGIKANSAAQNSAYSEFVKTGSYIADGLAQGIVSNKTAVTKSTEDIVKGVKDTLTSGLSIHSPSKVTEVYGENTVDGFVKGINNKYTAIKSAISGVVSLVIKKLSPIPSNITQLVITGSNYINYLMSGMKLTQKNTAQISDLRNKIISALKPQIFDISRLFSGGYSYITELLKGVRIKNTDTVGLSTTRLEIIKCLKVTQTNADTLSSSGRAYIAYLLSGMYISASDTQKISAVISGIYNSIVSSMNGLTEKLKTSSSNFMSYFTNPIQRSLSGVLETLDTFYIKFRNKWQAIANLTAIPFIGASLGVSKVPDLSGNYYPFGNNMLKLASGAVIQPNHEFMAILGDQKRGVNIETPLETMKAAFIDALESSGFSGGNITIPVYIGNEKIDTLIVNSTNRRSTRNNGRV